MTPTLEPSFRPSATPATSPSVTPSIIYTLREIDGDGDGDYPATAVTSIVAYDPPSGQEFDTWTVVSGNATISDVTLPTAVLTMLAGDVTVVESGGS